MIKIYLLRIISASIICSIISSIGTKSSAVWTVIRLLSRIFLVITLISPLLHINFSDITYFSDNISFEANQIIEQKISEMNSNLRNSIKEQTEAYILNKATSMNLDLIVEVTVSNDDPPVPVSVSLSGRIAPYAKTQLSQLISDDLGISKENQKWK